MLKIVHRVTKEQIEKINSEKRPQKPSRKQQISFVRSGQQSVYKQKKSTTNDATWDGSWEIGADLSGCERFFPIPTSKKPDIVVWCADRKIVYLVELTVPHEDNIEAAYLRKNDLSLSYSRSIRKADPRIRRGRLESIALFRRG